MDCSSDDAAMLVDRFMVLGARWCLNDVQVATLLSLDVMFDKAVLLSAVRRGGVEAEHRMQLLVDVDAMLRRLVPDGCDVAVWLRSQSVGYADDTMTPLDAMVIGAPGIRVIRDYLSRLSSRRACAARNALSAPSCHATVVSSRGDWSPGARAG